MNKAQIIEAIYKDAAYRNVCRNIASPALFEDLFHEVIINLLNMPDEKIQQAKDKKYLKFLFVKIAHNSWNSKHSPFYRKYRHNDSTESIDILRDLEADIDYDLERKEDVYHFFTQDIIEQIEALDWYDQTLLKLYIDIGDFRKISVMTGIKYMSLRYNIKNTIKKLKLDNHDRFKNFSDSYNT
jgi:DNA-directed RNA polymerase specialized sigma24 family protein